MDVDGERWTVVAWYVQEQGISQIGTGSSGGRTIQHALRQVQGEASHQRDVWHLCHRAARVQGQLDRALEAEHERVEMIRRHAEHEAEGKRRRSRRPQATLSEQKVLLTQITAVTEGGHSLCQVWHTLREVVVSHTAIVVSRAERQGESEALLNLLDELAPLALPSLQGRSQTLATQICLALPQTLLCARRLDAIHEQAVQALGPEAVAVLAWIWPRRAVRGPTSMHLLQGVRPTWHTVASELLVDWDRAARASSAVEHWQSVFGLMWPFITSFRLACVLCWLFGIITGRLFIVSTRVFPLSNGPDHPSLIPIGWQLWTLPFRLFDCANVLHGCEPCLTKSNLWWTMLWPASDTGRWNEGGVCRVNPVKRILSCGIYSRWKQLGREAQRGAEPGTVSGQADPRVAQRISLSSDMACVHPAVLYASGGVFLRL